MVHYIATDCPSSKFFEEARDVCPNVAAVCLDPIHLARVYEYGQWNKKTAGSTSLRRVLKQILVVDQMVSQSQ